MSRGTRSGSIAAVALLRPLAPPYDPLDWAKRPFPERARMVCEAWALQGSGAPLAVYVLHAVKLALYAGAWVLFCSTSPSLGGLSTIGDWWLHPLAFQKAILWSMLFEGLGFGCGFGPLSGRYAPPVGGALYFLRPGTTKLALFARAPLLGGTRRTPLDVALYFALLALLVRALLAPALGASHLVPIAALVPVLAVADRTIFLALRAEHYWTTVVVFAATADWIGGAKAVQLALWLWAGVSKLNHHFPTVVCVMTSNSPFARFAWLRRRMYVRYPDDLRPSRLAIAMSHAGTALELGVPIVLACSTGETAIAVGIAMALALHAFITSNVPMGAPIEWNLMVVYGVFALFWAHPGAYPFDVGPPRLGALLAIMLVAVPLLGNIAPGRISFLLAMRYYAGNWPYSVWLFRGDSYRKLDRLVKAAPWIYDQLDRFYDHATSVGLVGKVLAFRLMHLQGRALPVLLPKAIEGPLHEYEYLDGELVGGLALGWNFGDGHLHRDGLLRAIQDQCGFAPGELRCIFVESQPLGGAKMAYQIHDAASGLLDAGELDVRELRGRQPWAGP
ncbi:putative membrane protein [Sorangium cellulosum So ce56]|uniref:Membrane protein n=1 Tax=Sorangium cellulosum (strain So ce56) TaxID=448385 RepID=A9G2Z3_SORC5|nr:putative membrane protein [Sorangium cellulosum So ce56]